MSETIWPSPFIYRWGSWVQRCYVSPVFLSCMRWCRIHIGVSVVYYLNCTFFLQCNFCVWVNWLLLALITEFLNTVYFCRILAEPDAWLPSKAQLRIQSSHLLLLLYHMHWKSSFVNFLSCQPFSIGLDSLTNFMLHFCFSYLSGFYFASHWESRIYYKPSSVGLSFIW